ncbi:MAG: iron complex outermembrane receptor protein [Bradyrhizobium sp.]|jgi:iron complex outermembrane receptor protein
MNQRNFTLSPFALAAFLLAGSTAQAQTTSVPASTEPQVLQRVTVSASADASAAGLPVAYPGGQVARGGRLGLLGNTDVMDAPFNSTNYTQALIQDQQSHSVADVLQNDPSVRVARGFGNYQELYMIRGFAVSSDDIAYNGLFGLLPRQFVAAELLERVEVFRGANTFLNGAAPGGGGVGGSINLLPKRAGNAPLTQITAGTESGGQTYLATDIGRRFGPENALGIRINAVRRDGDTAVDREQRSLSVLSVGLDYRTGNVRLSADAGFQEHKLTAPRPSVTLAGGIAMPQAPDASRNFAQPWTYSNERDTFGTVRGEIDLSKDVVAWAALGARSGTEANVLTPLTVNQTTGAATLYRFDNQRQDTVRTGEIGVRGKVQTGPVSHSLCATLSGFSLDSRNAYALSDFYSNPIAGNIYKPVDVAAPAATFFTGGKLDAPLTTRKSILSSYALADTMSFADERVLLTIGARNQTIKDTSYDYGSGARTSRYDQSLVTPMAGLVIKPMKDLSVYANYIEGLQQGPVASGTGVTNLGQSFAPYKSKQKEIGIKYDAGTVGMSAAVFTTAQPSAYVRNNVFGVFGEQRNRGLELSVFGTPVRGVRVLGGLTVLDAKQVSTVDGLNDGKDAIGVPRQQFNLGAEWDVPGAKGLTLTGRTVVTSSQYADGANTQELPSWTRVDVGARYVTLFGERALTLRARVDNLTDKNYWASAGGYPGAGYLVLGAPRTVVLSASIDF